MSNLELILIRGLPGSGKSTLAKSLLDRFNSSDSRLWDHIEADDYFTFAGKYLFDPTKLQVAHTWCQKWTKISLNHETSVIVSNTFSRVWEMQPYIDMAKEFNAKLTVLTCEGNYGSVHGVPDETIEKMKNRWENWNG